VKTIYAVNSGIYSSYHIVALFSAREKAEAFMRAVPDSEYNKIEEYKIDPNTADLITRGYSMWRVRMLLNGDVEEVGRTDTGDGLAHHLVWPRSTAPAYKGTDVKDCLCSKVWAKSEKAAIKIANEHRIQMAARGEIKV
jgi:hypothetical protein